MAKRKYPELELTVEDVTPDLAEEWLEKNVRNRRVSDRLVEVYAEAMENDEWVLNGEPIIFDRAGRLQSGQHRLLAVVASGVTIRSVIVRGAEPDYIYSLDSGRKRRMSDVLTLRGEKDVAVLASSLVWTWRYQHGVMDRTIAPTTTHQLKLLEENQDLRDYCRMAHRAKSNLPVSVGLLAALLKVFYEINATDAEYFFEKLLSGDELPSDSPIFVLRRWLIRTKMESRRPGVAMYGAVIIKAWNAYRDHQNIRTLRWAASETFPEAI